MTALAADIGTGNIVGVSTAIYIGGPGALFWMWVTALVGMATKFSEVLLSVHFREKTPAGNWVGGAMYFIKNGLGPKWMWLGSCFALFGIVACIGTGAMVQGNSIGEAIQANLSIPTWFTAIAVFLLAGAVLIGGVKRIGAVAGKVVPAMAVIYVLISLIVIILHIDQLPRVLAWVVAEAFTPTAAEGGFAGATVMMAIRMGMARGVFSNEAGLGTAPMAHAAATSASPLVQASIGMLDTFIDTIIVCTMTGFAILDRPVDLRPHWGRHDFRRLRNLASRHRRHRGDDLPDLLRLHHSPRLVRVRRALRHLFLRRQGADPLPDRLLHRHPGGRAYAA